MADILRALEKKYEGDIAVATANISVYQSNPAGIGEHPDVVGAIDMEIEKMATADEKLQAVRGLFGVDLTPTLLNG